MKCPHEDNITYGSIEHEDGIPFYNVHCETCGKDGRIYLAESKEEWFDENEPEILVNNNKKL